MSTTRILTIVRHAKSSWDYEGIADIDRHLKVKGIRDAYEIARRLKIERQLPDTVISSPAIRALHTADIFMRVFDLNFSKLKVDERLYGSGISVIKKVISEQPEAFTHIMIFGHNPDFSELATNLSGDTFIDLPSCGLFKIEFECDSWSEISPKNLKETWFDFPNRE